MPAIVVVFAVIAVYGQGGWIAEALRAVGVDPRFRIFGWPGIVLAHVFLNAPFVARVYLGALAAVPTEHWRLAQTLGFTPREVMRHLDWPVVRSELAGLASLVFLLCFTSFAIVLTLGGGSGRATLEVAIFEALRVDLDFARAAWIGLVQIAICAGVAVVLHGIVARPPVGQTIRAPIPRPDAADPRLRLARRGCARDGGRARRPAPGEPRRGPRSPPGGHRPRLPAGAPDEPRDRDALRHRGVRDGPRARDRGPPRAPHPPVSRHRPGLRRRTGPRAGPPPFALTAGLFLLIRRVADPAAAGYVLLPLINALGALPFAYRFISPPVMVAGERYGRLADLIGLKGTARLAIVDWPLLRRPLAAGFAMSLALSFGDFGVIALFGGRELRTLPYLLYERLGAYRLEEASAIGLVLVLIAAVARLRVLPVVRCSSLTIAGWSIRISRHPTRWKSHRANCARSWDPRGAARPRCST